MEILNSIFQFITHDYWTYITDTSLVTEESVITAIVIMSMILMALALGAFCVIMNFIRRIKQGIHIAKPALHKLGLNMMKFEFRYLYLPHLESPIESITEEYHHIIAGTKPGMPLDPKVYNSLMKEQNRKLANVLSAGSLKLLEEYMEEPMYLGIGLKRNIEATYSVYTFRDGKPSDNRIVSTRYFKKFKKHKHFCRMNFGCCKLPVIVITEYGGAKASQNIIRDQHDMELYDHIWNNICFCISRWIPVIGICVNTPRDDGEFICETLDAECYRSRVYAHLFINKNCIHLRDDDHPMSTEDMEAMFEHFHTRENLMEMVGSDYALDLRDKEYRKQEMECIQSGGITLHTISIDTMNDIIEKAKADGRSPVKVLCYKSVEDAIEDIQKNSAITSGSIAIVYDNGSQFMYNIIRTYMPTYTLKQISRNDFSILVCSDDIEIRVWRYPTLEAFQSDYRSGIIGVTLNKDILVLELKGLPDEYYLIRK